MAAGRTSRQRNSTDKQPKRGVPTGKYILCPGVSAGVHRREQVWLPLVQGAKFLFVRCPFVGCRATTFCGNDEEWRAAGLTKEQVLQRNPHAVFC